MAVFTECEFTPEKVLKLRPIGFTLNTRRDRTVSVFQHPSDESKVVTVGNTFDGFAMVIAVEPATLWEHARLNFPQPRMAS